MQAQAGRMGLGGLGKQGLALERRGEGVVCVCSGCRLQVLGAELSPGTRRRRQQQPLPPLMQRRAKGTSAN